MHMLICAIEILNIIILLFVRIESFTRYVSSQSEKED